MPMWRTGSGDLAAGLIFKPSTSALMTGAASTPVVANYGLALWGHGTSVDLPLRARTRAHQP